MGQSLSSSKENRRRPRPAPLTAQSGSPATTALALALTAIIVGQLVAHAVVSEEGLTPVGAGLMALFATLGLVIATWRRGVTVDFDRLEAVRWWGLARPILKKRFSVQGYGLVSMRHEDRSRWWHLLYSTQAHKVYAIALEGEPGRRDVWQLKSRLDAAHFAERLARRLGISLRDETAGPAKTIDARTLERPLVARIEEELAAAGSVGPAPGKKVLARATPEEALAIELGSLAGKRPRATSERALKVLAALVTAGALLGALVIILSGDAGEGGPPSHDMFLAGAVMMIAGVLSILLYRYARGAPSIRVTEGFFSLDAPLGERVEIPVEDLMVLEVEQCSAAFSKTCWQLSARGRETKAEVGRGLSKQELDWVRRRALEQLASLGASSRTASSPPAATDRS